MYVVTVFLTLFSFSYAAAVTTKLETEDTAAAISEFSLDLLKKLHVDGKNTFFSGYSIAAALGVLSLGARQNTLIEINKAAHFDLVNANDSHAIHRAFKSCAETYIKRNTNFNLTTANRLFGSQIYKIEQQYQDDSKNFYGGELQLVDFGSGTAEGIINDWVSEQTNDKIKDFFPPESINADTILVLVNTIYFKANWEREFKSEDSRRDRFFTSETTQVPVQVMAHQTGFFNYYSDSNVKAEVLELPYVGQDVSMFVVLPNEINGLTTLIESLTAEKLVSLMNSAQSREIGIELPRFKLETEYSLVQTLQSLGIHDLFDRSKCDVSGISGEDNDDKFYVSKAVHKTFVQVAEEGTEAAALTGIQFPMDSESEGPQFIANHPFLFEIRDNTYKIPLFVGVVSNPPTVSSE